MCAPLEHNNLASDKILPPTNHNAPAMRSSYAAAQCPPSTRGPQSAYRPAERAEGGLCALRAAPNPMSEREHELHRRMTSLTERHRAWPRSWARTERAVPRDPFAGGVGSSPHTRGAPGCVTRDARRNRDHPRIRGEHSPAGARDGAPGGIIPAYAGSTLPEDVGDRDLWGPSPHTREHVIHALGGGSVRGIIPAYAGSTSIELPGAADKAGSSPHTRGTRARAYASSSSCRDHPRIRGEHFCKRSHARA